MKKEKKLPTYNHYIQIGNKEEINMNTLTEEEREDIGIRLNRQALLGAGYKEVGSDETDKTA